MAAEPAIDLDLAEFTVMTPFPHTKGYDDYLRQGRIFDFDWDHYNAGQVVFHPKQMSAERLQELYEYAKDSLYVEDVAVYSPKGDIFTLPRGATALDYAYEIHTQVGLYAKEAYVNRMRVPLLTELRNGDIVSIVTGDEPKYRCSWLSSVKTGKARATIRSYCKQKIRDIKFTNLLFC